MRIVFVTRALFGGGIDRALATLAEGLTARGHAVGVVTLFGGDGGAFDERVRTVAPTFDAGVRSRWDLGRVAFRATAWIRKQRPDLIHGLNVETNLVAMLAGRLPARARVVWGIRWDDPSLLAFDRRGHAAARLHAGVAPAADLVIANSHAGGNYARKLGVSDARLRVIYNGIDLEEFRPDPGARARLRSEWGVNDAERLIGTVGLDPVKRHREVLRAAHAFLAGRAPARIVFVGACDPEYRRTLEELADVLGLTDRLLWAGRQRDMRAVYNALDLVTLLSSNEGTPNSIAEAMACGVPCVVSDAGDAAFVVGDSELVVAPVTPQEVARAWGRALARPWTDAERLSLRDRVATELGLERMLSETEAALLSLL